VKTLSLSGALSPPKGIRMESTLFTQLITELGLTGAMFAAFLWMGRKLLQSNEQQRNSEREVYQASLTQMLEHNSDMTEAHLERVRLEASADRKAMQLEHEAMMRAISTAVEAIQVLQGEVHEIKTGAV